MVLMNYFDRLAIIHLPNRIDRLRALRRELARVGIDIDCPKICIPDAPVPDDANGYPSRGVYGNFLSHLNIIRAAHRDNLETVWVLEDDAIFSERFRKSQSLIAETLKTAEWGMCFLGHSMLSGLSPSATGLVRYDGPFIWAHCYAVHRRAMPALTRYMLETMNGKAGKGGKMYIDGAFTHFRSRNPELPTLIASPCLSIQKGSPSGLNTAHWYDKNPLAHAAVSVARKARDECWRRGWFTPS